MSLRFQVIGQIHQVGRESNSKRFLLVAFFFYFSIKVAGAQRAKKVVSDNPGLVDFAIGLVNSVLNLPNGLVMGFEEFEEQEL